MRPGLVANQPTCPPLSQSISQSINRSVNHSLGQSINQSIHHRSVNRSINQRLRWNYGRERTEAGTCVCGDPLRNSTSDRPSVTTVTYEPSHLPRLFADSIDCCRIRRETSEEHPSQGTRGEQGGGFSYSLHEPKVVSWLAGPASRYGMGWDGMGWDVLRGKTP